MKKFLKKAVFEILKFILILTVIYGLFLAIYNIGSYSEGQAYSYTMNNTQNGAKKITPRGDNNFADHLFYISDDPDKANEIRIFRQTHTFLGDFFNWVPRYKELFHTVSEDNISSLCFELESSAEIGAEVPNTVLLYYSHNKDMADYCTYEYMDENGNIYEKTKSITRYQPFMIIIPCVYNNGNWKNDILRVSFYNVNGELIFEDIRT